MAKGTRESMEVKQLSHDGHLPMKSTPESMGYELWPSCDVTLKSRTITSVHIGVRVDLPLGYAGIIYKKWALPMMELLLCLTFWIPIPVAP